MGYIYRKCTLADRDILTKVRIEVLRAANRLPDSENLSQVEQNSRNYYQSSLIDGGHTTYLAYNGPVVVGAGVASFYRVMPTYQNPTGTKAYNYEYVYSSLSPAQRNRLEHTGIVGTGSQIA